MKRLLAALILLSSSAFGSQSLATGTATGTLPTGAPWNSLTNWRAELRVHGWSYTASYQPIHETNAFYLRASPSQLLVTSQYDTGFACGITVPSGTDVILRFQRVSASSSLTAEAWNTVGGAEIFQDTCPITTPGTPNDSGSTLNIASGSDSNSFNGAIAYVRTFTTTVALGTPPSNIPPCLSGGTLTDLEFEGNLTDCSAHVTLVGSSPTYVTTPARPPASFFNTWPTLSTFRAGQAISLANGSFSMTDNAALSYLWQQLSGPLQGTFSNVTTANPTFTAPIAGSYTIQVTATDSQSTSYSATVGAVATDSNGVVVTGLQTAVDSLLGPLLQIGKTPWIYGDLMRKSVGDTLAVNALANPPFLGAAIRGTSSMSNMAVALTGTGTHYTADLTNGECIIVGWDSVDGTGTGRFTTAVQSITDDTHLTTNTYFFGGTLPTAATVYACPAATSTFLYSWWQGGFGSTFWNFYDAALAYYRIWAETGDSKYLSWFRQLADYQWTWMLDHGYAAPPARSSSLASQYLRALDGHLERLPGLYNYISYFITNLNGDNPSLSPNIDVREMGYVHWGVAETAKVDTDATRHAQACTWLNTITPQWVSAQTTYGSWQENVFAGNQGYIYAPLAGVYGISPWRVNILLKALQASYEVFTDGSSQGCTYSGSLPALLTSITNGVAFVHNYGYGSANRGIFYDVIYPSNAVSGCQFVAPACNGTASATLGSAIVTGSGSNFMASGLLNCNGTDYIGFWTSSTIYRILSCQSNTQITLAANFGTQGESGNISGSVWRVAKASSTTCGSVSITPYCNSDQGAVLFTPPQGDIDLVRFVPGTAGWLYNQTGNSTYTTWGDDAYSAGIGSGPAAGPTNLTDVGAGNGYIPGCSQSGCSSCAGPNCSGFVTEIIGNLPDCNTNPPPCGQNNANAFQSPNKNFGEAFGAPNSDSYLAWRIGGHAPAITRTVYVPLCLASLSCAGAVPSSSKAYIALTQADLTVASATCSTAVCTLTNTHAEEGSATVTVTYLTSGNAVLAPGLPATIQIQ